MTGALLHLATKSSVAISRVSYSPVANGNLAVLPSPASAGNLITVMHRRSGTPPGVPAGASLITNLGTGYSAFWETADAGQTNVQGTSGQSVDRMLAIAYAGAKAAGVTNFSMASGSSISPSWPSLALEDPGNSWVVGFLGFATSGVPLNSISLPSPASILQNGDRVYAWDTGGPVSSFAGCTGTMGSGGVWVTLAFEVATK